MPQNNLHPFLSQAVLSQHLTGVWQQHRHQVLGTAASPLITESVSIINRELASLANSDALVEDTILVWKTIGLTATSMVEVLSAPVPTEQPIQGELFDELTNSST